MDNSRSLSLGCQAPDRCAAQCWLLCICGVVHPLNHVAFESLEWQTPCHALTGQCPDISALLQFRWWEPVCHRTGGTKFSKSAEALGRFVGIAEHQGNVLTCLMVTDDALQVIACSSARSAPDPENPNLRASTHAGESANGRTKPTAMSAQDIAAIGAEPSDLSLT